MEVLYTGKQEPFIFLSDGILTQYVSHSSFSKYTTNNTNEILNINKEMYENVCVDLFGVCHEIFFLKKSQRQNEYKENVYVWKKK
jgi:hypothetical protein